MTATGSVRLPLGYIRDRTSSYAAIRSQAYRGSSANLSTGILASEALVPRADASLVRRADGIDSQFLTLDTGLSDLRRLYDERLRPTFDSPRELDARIEAETARISQLIARLRDDIRGTARAAGGQRHQLETAMQQGHASRLRAMTLQFREMQTAYLNRLKTSEQPVEDPDAGIDIDISFTGSQLGQIQEQRRDLEERNEQIRRLLPMISQLTEMFADLGTLIVEQGTMLDRIDGHLEAALDDMRSGNEQLKQAEEHQKGSTKWFICYMVFMILLILILGTVILVRKGKKQDEAEAGTE
jgi:syntaxin 16